MAGGVLHSLANSSGSAAAIAGGSMETNRSSTFAGPRKACSIGYCWSSIMPTRSANGDSSRTASAFGSPVMWKPMAQACRTRGWTARGLLLRLDRHHRAVCVQQDALGVAAEDQLPDGRPAAQADHDQLGRVRLGDADQVLGGLEAPDQLADVVGDACLVEPCPHRVHVGLGLAGGLVVEVVAATVRVD